jgi:polyferredoxin
VPVEESWIDATPLVVLFVLMAAAGYLMHTPYARWARRGTQIIMSFIFIFFLHRCLCAFRGSAWGFQTLGHNDLIAFSYLCPFILMIAFAFTFGRVFCGWLCPMSLIQDILGIVARMRRNLARARVRLLSGYIMLLGAAIWIGWVAYRVKPRTQFLPENSAEILGILLLLISAYALLREPRDASIKRSRYVIVSVWLAVVTIGIFVTNPWCVLYGNEEDYSAIVSLVALVTVGLVIPFAWCRYICPLGTVLGLIAPHAGQRLVNHKTCEGCGKCTDVCGMGALDHGEIDRTSCIYCCACIGTCGYAWERKEPQGEAKAL